MVEGKGIKFLISLFWGLSFIWPACPVRAQGTFRNLGFESANLLPIPSGQLGGPVSSLDAIPGWQAFLGTTQVTQVLQSNLTLGNASISVLGPYFSLGGIMESIIEGQYSVVLQPGLDPFGSEQNVDASISQTGLVPANARSLHFKATTFTSFPVSMGGQYLSLIKISQKSRWRAVAAQIDRHFAPDR